LTFFQEKFRNFQEHSCESQKLPKLSLQFQDSTSTAYSRKILTELDRFLTFFQEKFKIFLRKFQKKSILKKCPNTASQKAFFNQHLSHLAILQKRFFFLTPKRFQNSQD
jgi:hypothetical protein